MKLIRHVWLLAFPALAVACQLVDPESDLHDDLAGSPDATSTVDAGRGVDGHVATEAAPADGDDGADDGDTGVTGDDGGGDVSSDASLCVLNAAAALCDDFNRSVLVPDGGPNWVDCACNPPGTSANGYPMCHSMGQAFDPILPRRAADASCGLQSVVLPSGTDWHLDFDLTSDFLAASPTPQYLGICRLDFAYDAGVDGGLLSQSFRLSVGNDNSATFTEVEQSVGMAAPREVPIAQTTDDQPFLLADGGLCHIHVDLVLDAPQTSLVKSKCDGQLAVSLGGTPGSPLLASPSGAAVLYLGFDDPSVPVQYGSHLVYDNVVLVTNNENR